MSAFDPKRTLIVPGAMTQKSSVKKSGAVAEISTMPSFFKNRAGELHRQVAGKPIRAFHNDPADTVHGNAV
jgi:hypothetical protein